MALYIMASEPLIRNINKNTKSKGLAIDKNRHIKITAYADDTTIFIGKELEEIEFQKIFEKYEKASGARINKEKTKELAIGRLRKTRIHEFKTGLVVSAVRAV